MGATDAVAERPRTIEEAASLVRRLGAAGEPVRVRGGSTKLGWGPADPGPVHELHTGGLDHILEHNEGDFTAVLQAGVPLAEAQARFAAAGQMLALDPPLHDAGGTGAATIGGVMASADSGPLRHRFGGIRDLVLGVTVVLSDGTVAKAGGRVIKNVAGYDLGKLFCGSHGTLGLIAVVAVRLHPLVEPAATARAAGDDPVALAQAAIRLAGLPLEADCLDVGWSAGAGELLVRFAGARAPDRAQEAVGRMVELGFDTTAVIEQDGEVWERQRTRQRAPEGLVIRASTVIAGLADVLRAGEAMGARVVARAGLGLAWLSLPLPAAERDGALEELRRRLPEATLTVLDGGPDVTAPWPAAPAGIQPVLERLKARFDPAGVFRPGVMVGGG